jgi:hypothetical protein
LHATTAAGKSVEWTYRLDGDESKYKVGEETMNSAVKWEGAALLVNTLVNGARSYTIMDRWTLSRDRTQLNIQRQVMRGQIQDEGYLIYRLEGSAGAPATSTGTAVTEPEPATADDAGPPARTAGPAAAHAIHHRPGHAYSAQPHQSGEHQELQGRRRDLPHRPPSPSRRMAAS